MMIFNTFNLISGFIVVVEVMKTALMSARTITPQVQVNRRMWEDVEARGRERTRGQIEVQGPLQHTLSLYLQLAGCWCWSSALRPFTRGSAGLSILPVPAEPEEAKVLQKPESSLPGATREVLRLGGSES